jgi:hypothetical protein
MHEGQNTVKFLGFFSLPLDHQRSNSNLHHSAHRHISISHVSVLCHNQHNYFRLNHFRIHFVYNKIEKQIELHTNLNYNIY